eukprot:CAMPEP_0175134588 /NCGR_PEP_ID=MMETSP0087-20121206/8259_1 /TAXON_ID=136419 /ORGANISM="Unknown Unknown, Strain D1" /LENGTH=350 /DNA_ID=CAMNT_0016417161 /DNA_START=108 /DNA_END=1160 /DNA_ORIENTATION=+
MLTAAVARQHMTSNALARAEEILEILHVDYPYASSFIGSAHWADDIKATAGYAVRVMNAWHFINYGVSADNITCPGSTDGSTILTALTAQKDSLGDTVPDAPTPVSSSLSKALSIRFLVHLMGDLHQPLHATTRCSTAHPKGDDGGNAFSVTGLEGVKNLHSVWDSMGLQYPEIDALCPYLNWTVCHSNEAEREEVIKATAEAITTEFPMDSFQEYIADDVDTFEKWALEALALVEAGLVYDGVIEGERPSEQYLSHVANVTRSRVALGGYRLAAVLNALLSSMPPLPAGDGDSTKVEVLTGVTVSLSVAVIGLAAFAFYIRRRGFKASHPDEFIPLDVSNENRNRYTPP